jgi:tRNA-binding protein
MSAATSLASIDDFQKLDIRVGQILEAEDYPEGKSSTHVLTIDFGAAIGMRKSLARLRPNYRSDELIGRLVLCVVNFPPRQIGRHRSEVLTLGLPDTDGAVVLVQPERPVPLGGRLY